MKIKSNPKKSPRKQRGAPPACSRHQTGMCDSPIDKQSLTPCPIDPFAIARSVAGARIGLAVDAIAQLKCSRIAILTHQCLRGNRTQKDLCQPNRHTIAIGTKTPGTITHYTGFWRKGLRVSSHAFGLGRRGTRQQTQCDDACKCHIIEADCIGTAPAIAPTQPGALRQTCRLLMGIGAIDFSHFSIEPAQARIGTDGALDWRHGPTTIKAGR